MKAIVKTKGVLFPSGKNSIIEP